MCSRRRLIASSRCQSLQRLRKLSSARQGPLRLADRVADRRFLLRLRDERALQQRARRRGSAPARSARRSAPERTRSARPRRSSSSISATKFGRWMPSAAAISDCRRSGIVADRHQRRKLRRASDRARRSGARNPRTPPSARGAADSRRCDPSESSAECRSTASTSRRFSADLTLSHRPLRQPPHDDLRHLARLQALWISGCGPAQTRVSVASMASSSPSAKA